MRGIAELIARRRRELAMTQPELAAALVAVSGRDTVTRAEVSRWERGEVTPGRYWQRHLGQVLGVPPAELRAAATAEDAAPAARNADAAPTDWLRVAHEWLVLDPPQLVERRSGPRIGANLLDQIEQRVAELRRLDDHLAGADTYALISREMVATEQLAKDSAYTQVNGRGLLGALGELGQLAGWVAYDAGEHEVAARHYLAGAEAAREAGRQEIAANNLSSLAYLMTNTGSPQDGALLAATAVKGAEREHPAVRALMLDRLAWARARSGDADGTARALDAAADLLASAEHPPAWLYWLDASEAETMAGRCWTELRRPLRAVPLLESTTARLSADRPRELALYLSWLAVAYADAREPERAAHVGARVLELSRATSSTRAAGRMTEVLTRLAEYQAVPAVAELLTEAGAGLAKSATTWTSRSSRP